MYSHVSMVVYEEEWEGTYRAESVCCVIAEYASSKREVCIEALKRRDRSSVFSASSSFPLRLRRPSRAKSATKG